METLSRKQREILERETLIKITAREMLKENGFHQLSMDKIATKIEYSKGTIYQHYSCKEELTTALCLESMDQLIEMFSKAKAYQGNTRERMIAVLFAFVLHASLNPESFQNLQIIRSEAVRLKISEARQGFILEKESIVFSIVASIVIEAMEAKELVLKDNITPQDVVFGLWSTAYGGMILESTNIDWSKLGITDPLMSILQTNQATLDGLGWTPDSSTINLTQLLTNLRNNVFAEELLQFNPSTPNRSLIHG